MKYSSVKEGLRDYLIQVEFRALALMPWTSTVYGCAKCLVFWVDEPKCWVCEQDGILLAEPLEKVELFRQQYRRTT